MNLGGGLTARGRLFRGTKLRGSFALITHHCRPPTTTTTTVVTVKTSAAPVMSDSQCFNLFSAYDDAWLASKQVHGCDRTVLNALQAYYNLCGVFGSSIVTTHYSTPTEMIAYCRNNDGIQLQLAGSSSIVTSKAAASTSGSNSSVPFVSTTTSTSETEGVTNSSATTTAPDTTSVILSSATITSITTAPLTSQPSMPPLLSSPATQSPSTSPIVTNASSSTKSTIPSYSGPNGVAIAGSLIAIFILVGICFGVLYSLRRRSRKSDEPLIGPHTAYLRMDEEQDVYDIPLYYAQAAEVHGIARTDTTGSSQSLVNPRRGDTVFTAPSFSRGLTKSTVHSEADPTVFAESPFTDTPQPAPATTSFHIAIAPANPPAVVHVSSNEELSVLPAKQKGRPAFEAILDASYKDGGKARELALRGTPPALWTVDQVGIWAWGIPDMGPEVAKMMRYHKVGGNVLLRLRREDLRLDFGLVLGDAVVLEAEIDKLREVEEAPPMYSVTGRRNH